MNILDCIRKKLVVVTTDDGGVQPVYHMHMTERDGDKPPFRVSPTTGGVGVANDSMPMTKKQMRVAAAMLNHAADMMEDSE